MNVGFNHNVMYRGEIFHVQTEDSGIANPHIITLLYQGGTIVCSRKTSYADIIKMDNLDQVVQELMKEQHKDMLRRLKNGEFDDRAFPSRQPAPATKPAAAPEQTPAVASTPVASATSAAAPSSPPPNPPAKPQEKPSSLDEVILDFLLADDKN